MNSAKEKVWFTFNGPLKKLFFNFCHFYFPTFQMTIVKKSPIFIVEFQIPYKILLRHKYF